MKHKKHIAIVILTGLLACSPVRTDYFDKNKAGAEKQEQQADQPETFAQGQNQRFGDTTVIELKPNPIDRKLSLEDNFSEAMKLFDKEKFDEACPKFEQLAGIFPPDDSLYFESKFYNAECEIMHDDLVAAKIILEMLLEKEGMPGSVMQKVLVRLGQVYCVIGNKEKANTLFDRLKTEFPESIYNKIANCEAVKY